jgi:glyoxylase I family protein
MTTQTARCACGRVEITVEGDPLMVYVCHCEFCQRRSGNVFIASAQFAEEQVVSITGDTTRYNGLEVDGVGAVAIDEGINYHFCSVCGSSMYHDNVMPLTGQRIFAISLGAFTEDLFPPPTAEFFTKHRHRWVRAVPDAVQLRDPLGADAQAAFELADGRARSADRDRDEAGLEFPGLEGFGHIDLTVTDVDRTVEWWERVMGFTLVNTRDTPDFRLRSVIHPCGFFIGFMTHGNPVSDRFDERAVGLDHLALRVADRAALTAWAEHLDDRGVAHSGIQEEQAGPVIVFRDPDNIQLELWAFDTDLVRAGLNATPMSEAPS